jgi:hypothetical protein
MMVWVSKCHARPETKYDNESETNNMGKKKKLTSLLVLGNMRGD